MPDLATDNNGRYGDSYKSKHIMVRISTMLGDNSLDEVIGEEYYRDVKECLDIMDIEYPVTAIGILGRAIELCTKEYFKEKVKNKTTFQINTANLPITTIRKYFCGSDSKQADRLKLLNQQEVTKNGNKLKLKRKLLKDDSYNTLLAIKDARNDAFHGCNNIDEYNQLESKAFVLIELGIIILVSLIKEINMCHQS